MADNLWGGVGGVRGGAVMWVLDDLVVVRMRVRMVRVRVVLLRVRLVGVVGVRYGVRRVVMLRGVVLHVKGVLHVRVVLHWRRVVLDIHRRDYTVMMGRTIGIYRLARCLWARLKCR